MMHRPSSSNRLSGDFFTQFSLSSPAAPNFKAISDSDELPTYDPQSEGANRERIRLRYAETAVHLIPLLLALCAVVLWYFSYPIKLRKR